MNNLDRENADKVLRTLYHLAANEMKEYMLVCEMNEIPADQRDAIYKYLDSREFLKVIGKVGNGDVYLQLSKIGFKFFAEDNLIDEYVRTFRNPAALASTVYQIAGDASNFGNENHAAVKNSSTHLHNPEVSKEKWYDKFLHDTTTQIISALVVAGIVAVITWYFAK